MRCSLMLGISLLATLIAEGTRHCADARSLAEVRQSGILRLCANPSALPYSNLAENGGLAGFEVEIAKVVAHEMGLGLGVTWVRNAGEIRNSDCDVSMGVVRVSSRRAHAFSSYGLIVGTFSVSASLNRV